MRPQPWHLFDMGRRNQRSQQPPGDTNPWERERTLADAESDAETNGKATDVTCPCGSNEFLLEAYLQVVEGQARPRPVEVEQLTCPHCGREYEAVQAEDGRILRGEFLGYVELDDE